MYLLNFVLNNKGTIIIVGGGGGARMPKYNEMLLSGKTVEMLLRFLLSTPNNKALWFCFSNRLCKKYLSTHTILLGHHY